MKPRIVVNLLSNPPKIQLNEQWQIILYYINKRWHSNLYYDSLDILDTISS